MGTCCHCKQIKTNTQILKDIKTLTAITKSKHFEKRCGLLIDFFVSRRSNKYKIFERNKNDLHEDMNSIVTSEKFEVIIKQIKIDISKFYKFFNCVMNCLPIFYEEEFKVNFTMTKSGDTDDFMCQICMDRKSDVLLKCLHFFCEQCLTNWLPRDETKCPVCRRQVVVKYNESSEIDLSDRKWSFIEKEEVNCQHYIHDLDLQFVESMKNLIS